ncbi:Rho-GAP domain-containing protein [Entamoeba marina]
MSVKKRFGFGFFSRKTKPKVFGIPIETINPTYLENSVPLFLWDSARFISQNIQEGVFRIPGERRLADLMKKIIEKRGDFLAEVTQPQYDVHSVATVMLIFLRELPIPLIPYTAYDDFILVAKTFEEEQYNKLSALSTAINSYHELLLKLPEGNLKILAFYMNFFYHFCNNNVSVHKMQSNNISICIAPTLLHAKEESWESALSTIKYQSLTCDFLVKYYPIIFSGACSKECLLHPELQNLSKAGKKKLLAKLNQSLSISTASVTQTPKKPVCSTAQQYREELKQTARQEKHGKGKKKKLKQNQIYSTLCITSNEGEDNEMFEEAFSDLQKKRRPRSESYAMGLMFTENNLTTLPQFDISEIIQRKHRGTIKSSQMPFITRLPEAGPQSFSKK